MRSTIILRTAKKTASGVTFNRGKNGIEPRVLLGFVRGESAEPRVLLGSVRGEPVEPRVLLGSVRGEPVEPRVLLGSVRGEPVEPRTNRLAPEQPWPRSIVSIPSNG